MWRDAGLLRDAAGLKRAEQELDAMRDTMPQGISRRALEARNLHLVAKVMVQSALGREESRGAHFRMDYPQPGSDARHSMLRHGQLSFTGP
jgi:L-aspartate oxidase